MIAHQLSCWLPLALASYSVVCFATILALKDMLAHHNRLYRKKTNIVAPFGADFETCGAQDMVSVGHRRLGGFMVVCLLPSIQLVLDYLIHSLLQNRGNRVDCCSGKGYLSSGDELIASANLARAAAAQRSRSRHSMFYMHEMVVIKQVCCLAFRRLKFSVNVAICILPLKGRSCACLGWLRSLVNSCRDVLNACHAP